MYESNTINVQEQYNNVQEQYNTVPRHIWARNASRIMFLRTFWWFREGVAVQLHSFLTSALDGGKQLHTLAALLPRKEPPVPSDNQGGPQNRSVRLGVDNRILVTLPENDFPALPA